MIPQATLDSLDRYVNHKLMPGSFLTAVLSNDLFGAVGRADSENLAALPDLVKYIYNNVPSAAWGNRDTVWRYVEDKFYANLGE
jgi:hypothetical protein